MVLLTISPFSKLRMKTTWRNCLVLMLLVVQVLITVVEFLK